MAPATQTKKKPIQNRSSTSRRVRITIIGEDGPSDLNRRIEIAKQRSGVSVPDTSARGPVHITGRTADRPAWLDDPILGREARVPRRKDNTFSMAKIHQRQKDMKAERTEWITNLDKTEREGLQYVTEALGRAHHGLQDYEDYDDYRMDEDPDLGDSSDDDEWYDEYQTKQEASALQTARSTKRKPVLHRTHINSSNSPYARHLALMAKEWESLLPSMSNSYLRWKHEGVLSADGMDETADETSVTQLTLVGWKEYEKRQIIYPRSQSVVCAMIERGYLPTTPLFPTVAFSLSVLEVYHRVRVRCNTSHESWIRVLCDLQGYPYRHYLRTQLSNAYDAYTTILRHVQKLAAHKSGQDGVDYRLKNACDACQYKLAEEPSLPLSMLISGDGNKSSSRFASAGFHDHRKFQSDYFLDPDYVDRFKDDVPKRTKKGKKPAQDSGGIAEPGVSLLQDCADQAAVSESEDDDHDADKLVAAVAEKVPCAERWLANNGKESDGALDHTGDYLKSCRHLTVLKVADMIKSGELAKYGIALLHNILTVTEMDRIGFGQDINCVYAGTVKRSSIGELAKDLHLHFFVGAFHGYAHNRPCQLDNHPRFNPLAGLEDFEPCERIFSRQNLLAHLYRHASGYHRHQALHFFFETWNADRRLNLGDFLYNNYRQALAILRQKPKKVWAVERAHGLTDADWPRFLAEEKAYFKALKDEPEIDRREFEYMETLQNLADKQAELDGLRRAAGSSDSARSVAAARRKYLAVLASINRLDEVAGQMEDEMGIAERWTRHCQEWKDVEAELDLRDYNRALDRLEFLVVSRLFEMEKYNLRGTNYKTRTALGKALQARCPAIKTALNKYNDLALRLSPPRPALTFKTTVDYTFLNDFALLRYSRDDVRTRKWSDPTIREATVAWLLIQCAKNEIERLNVEVRRVHTSIRDRQEHMRACIEMARRDDPLLAEEMQTMLDCRLHGDMKIYKRILDIHNLDGFSGDTTCGVRIVRVGVDAGGPHRPMMESGLPMPTETVEEATPAEMAAGLRPVSEDDGGSELQLGIPDDEDAGDGREERDIDSDDELQEELHRLDQGFASLSTE